MATQHQPEESRKEPSDWDGQTVVDRDGAKIGKLERIYRDRDDDSPTWGVVKAGRQHPVVPLRDAERRGGKVRVPVAREQVRSAPKFADAADIDPDAEDRLNSHYAGHGAYSEESGRGGSPLGVRRSRGVVSGSLLLLLGLFGALLPLVGPYFGFGFGTSTPWLFGGNRLLLSILPCLVVVLGAVMLIPSANRAVAGLGAWLCVIGGIWLVVGPSVSQFWGSGGPNGPIGPASGSTVVRVLEQLLFFYALGAAIIALGAFALGRMAVRSIKD